MSSLGFEFQVLLVGNVMNELANVLELSLELWRVVPFFHFVEHESFSLCNSISSIHSTDGLHWPGVGIVREIKHRKTGSKRSRWLNVMSESDVWVSLNES